MYDTKIVFAQLRYTGSLANKMMPEKVHENAGKRGNNTSIMK